MKGHRVFEDDQPPTRRVAMTRTTRAPSLARLSTYDDDDNVVAIIETRSGTRTKLAFDEESEAFVVKKVLPQGMSFPFDYGFIPSTLGDDGDPLDVLVLMDEPVPTGAVVPSRLIGVIEASQTEENGVSDTNDRLIAVAMSCELFHEVKKLGDLPDHVVAQIERFFVTYNEEEGKEFKVKGKHGPKRAKALLKRSMRRRRR
jgi:inorganic pyrophosphatase